MLKDIINKKLEDITSDITDRECFNELEEEIAGCGCGSSGNGSGGCSGTCGTGPVITPP